MNGINPTRDGVFAKEVVVFDGTHHRVHALLHLALSECHGLANVTTSCTVCAGSVSALIDKGFKTLSSNLHSLLAGHLSLLHSLLTKRVNAAQVLHVTLKSLALLLTGARLILVIS